MTVDFAKASCVIVAPFPTIDKPSGEPANETEVSDIKNVKGKAGYDRTIGPFEGFRRWQGYHDVGLSVSLHLIVVPPEG